MVLVCNFRCIKLETLAVVLKKSYTNVQSILMMVLDLVVILMQMSHNLSVHCIRISALCLQNGNVYYE